MKPALFGILNITEDSFSDGARYLDPDAALTRAQELARDADVIDIGAASSKPDAIPVPPGIEIARMAPVVAWLKQNGTAVSIDSFAPEVQRWALAQGVDYLNDVRGFPDESLYPALAESPARLIVMFSVEARGPATRILVPVAELLDRMAAFFSQRIAALAQSGVVRDRIVLDPGMGLFLGSHPDASFTVLRRIADLKRAFGLPVLVSVSRKSFLRNLVGRTVERIGPATLGAELYAAGQGADFIRTHDPGALKDALAVLRALDGNNP